MPLMLSSSTVQLAFFVDKSLTCKNQISPLIRFLKVQVLDYREWTFLLLFADNMPFPSVQIYSTNVLSRLVIDTSKLIHWEQKSQLP